jgi:hypothetical protein
MMMIHINCYFHFILPILFKAFQQINFKSFNSLHFNIFILLKITLNIITIYSELMTLQILKTLVIFLIQYILRMLI